MEISEPDDGAASSAANAGRQTLQSFREDVSVFKYLSLVERGVMYKLCTRKHYEDGEVILQEGAPGTGLHIVERGQVIVSKRGKSGKEVILATVGQGATFGEMSILNNQLAMATVTAFGEVDVLVTTPTQFTNLLHRSEALGIKILRALCEELSIRLIEAEQNIP